MTRRSGKRGTKRVWWRRTLRGFVGIVALLALVFAAGYAVSQTAWGRARLAPLLAYTLSAAIPGEAEIGAVERISGLDLTVSDLTFRAPGGSTVLALDRVNAHVDLGALLAGELRIARATTQGGRLVVQETSGGVVPLERAFSTPGADPDTGAAPSIAIHDVRVQNLAVVLDFDGVDPLVIDDVHALLRVDRPARAAVEVRWSEVRGRLARGLPLATLELKGLEGRVRGRAEHVLTLRGPVHLIDTDVNLHVDYYNERRGNRVQVHVTDGGVSIASLATLGLVGVTEALHGIVEVELGAPDHDG